MGRIPMGNFGNRGPDPVQTTRIANPGTDDLAAVGRLAGTVGAIAEDRQQELRSEDEALARAKAANALWDHELQVRAAADDVAERVATGELPYTEAEAFYQERVGKIEAPRVDGLGPAALEQLDGGVRRNSEGGRITIAQTVGRAKRADFRSQFYTGLDSLGKLASTPGADVDAINAKADAFAPLALQSELPPDQVSKALQDFKDKNWTNHATGRYIAGREDPAALAQLEHDLTAEDGYYTTRLDTDKRNALLSQVMGGRVRLEAKAQFDVDKREAVAEREVTWFRDQMVTGQEISAERWSEGLANVQGTGQAEAFAQTQRMATEILEFRVRPFAEQEAYLRALETQTNTTPSDDPKRDQSRLNTLRSAFDASKKQAQESPLSFYQNQTGQQIPPLDMASLAGGDTSMVAAQLQSRFAVLGSVRKSYGPDVAMNPWLPEEAAAVREFFQKADDRGRLAFLSTLSGATPDAAAFAGALKPVAADEPLFMAAGMAKFRKLTGPDGADVPTTILNGARILADKTAVLPGDRALLQAFDARVGDALPAGSSVRQRAFGVFQAVYAGHGAATGVRHEDVGGTIEADDDLADQAIDMAIGGVTDYNGAKVIRPYGMAEELFEDRLSNGLRGAADTSGLDAGVLEDMPLQPVPGKEGAYYLLNDGAVQLDPKTRKPIVVNVQ